MEPAEIRRFTKDQVKEATKDFSAGNCLGRGGFGTAYKGVLEGKPVIVMHLTPDHSRQATERFLREIATLNVRHPCIVDLLGFCAENRCVIYESLNGGELEERLISNRESLTQRDRVRISVEMAEALSFLHNSDPVLLHQDVKPANVMLDEKKNSKLGGLGLAKFMPVNDSSIWGTVGYVDPLFLKSGKYGPQSDVFGLGIVMLQMITGEKVKKVEELAKLGTETILDHLDSSIKWDDNIVREMTELAMQCRARSKRPDLQTVVLPALQALLQKTPEDEPPAQAPPPKPKAPEPKKEMDFPAPSRVAKESSSRPSKEHHSWFSKVFGRK